ncbi:MAG TPA: pyrroloquinoline quinone biosynthesis protein PqqE [Chthoniobacteraceae bacterium]|jgi:pyrroloquinoline quinone biosynthesis protein E|nr:pyrroloquinoline quinone biosynthesis protein PqqE [Chthoniobacteraceae bacterium]
MKIESRPTLAPHVYLRSDVLTGEPVLIFPEEMLALNEEAAAIIARCDGTMTAGDIIESLMAEYEADREELTNAVLEELDHLQQRRLLVIDGAPRDPVKIASRPREEGRPRSYRPYVLLAELTYKCPLHCPYCSNPVRYPEGELTTAEWSRVFAQAAALGIFHLALSGGEPLLRPDLPELVRAASEAGLYPNLITSGVGLNERRLRELREAGLESVQLSFQGDEAEIANRVAGTQAHELKLRAARMIQEEGLALSVNAVLHRANLSRLGAIIGLAETLGAERLELANVQYYGWGYLNREALLPAREQVVAAREIAMAAKQRLAGRMDIYYVLPDLYEKRPKPCMEGWGRKYMTVNPAGEVLPCPTASSIAGLKFDNVREHELAWIWNESESFQRFRGTEWMPLPCRECPQREVDFGGCRCQAALLTGDASATDPVCEFSPHREIVDRILGAAGQGGEWILRENPGHRIQQD